MTILFIIWIVSLAVLVVIALVGMYSGTRASVVSGSGFRPVRDIVLHESHQIALVLGRCLDMVRPPLSVFIDKVLSVLLRGLAYFQSFVMRRLFGRSVMPRGRAPSFFLKNIKEAKNGAQEGLDRKTMSD